ncbi:MAG: C10 family peptidase [Planctomycetota bacterium]|jgi:hypothetical protein
MRRNSLLFIVISVLLFIFSGTLVAKPMDVHQAGKAVSGWLRRDSLPLGAAIGQNILSIDSFEDDDGQVLYHVVNLEPTGFVIIAADDSIEPIIAFDNEGTYNGSSEDVLGELLNRDIGNRMALIRSQSPGFKADSKRVKKSKGKWRMLEGLGEGVSALGIGGVSDIRIDPFVQTRWGQLGACGQHCYNYYTPNHYYAGCVATSLAQVLKYFEYPTSGIGVNPYTIYVNGVEQTADTRGGDGFGGPYNWAGMFSNPDCGSYSDDSWEAVGALCYDAGLAVRMNYTSTGSTTDTRKAKNALVETFGYANAVKAYNAGGNIGPSLLDMVNPNLDARIPVILGITGSSGGHAIVCDGYGYNSSSLYHHLNMGWDGEDDAWYNLPNINSHPAYSSVYKCIYNIRPTTPGDGEMISGRVFDVNGSPLAGASVYAETIDESLWFSVTSDVRGIYAFADLDSSTEYTVTAFADGMTFEIHDVNTGTSSNNTSSCGNKRGVDFHGQYYVCDLDFNGTVAFGDFALFALSWKSRPGEANWNSALDISDPMDDVIDEKDLAIFTESWLSGE